MSKSRSKEEIVNNTPTDMQGVAEALCDIRDELSGIRKSLQSFYNLEFQKTLKREWTVDSKRAGELDQEAEEIIERGRKIEFEFFEEEQDGRV